MTLLQEIIDEATSKESSVESLLKKCLVLSYDIDFDEFKEWIEHELEGYPDNDNTPSYRKSTNLTCKGHFCGPFQSGYKNMPIAPACIKEEYQQIVFERVEISGVANISKLVESHDGKSSFQVPWPQDLVLMYSSRLLPGYTLVSAWTVISPTQLYQIIDTVKTRILKFCLEVRKKYPMLAEHSSAPTEKQEIAAIFHTNIYGGSNNIAQGSNGFSQQINLEAGDYQALKAQLLKAGLPDDSIQELEAVISKSPKPDSVKHLPPQLTSWLGKIATLTTSGSITLAKGVSIQLITKLILVYLGLA